MLPTSHQDRHSLLAERNASCREQKEVEPQKKKICHAS